MVTEFNGQQTGVMHACGHDAHTAILMGVADALVAMRADLPGQVMLIFQPAEEGAPPPEEGGAPLMLKEGLFKDFKPEAVFGLHVFSTLPAGTIGYRKGPLMAASDFFSVQAVSYTHLDVYKRQLLPPQAGGPARRDQEYCPSLAAQSACRMSATPSQIYDAGIARGEWQDDPAQRAVLVELDRLHDALEAPATPTGLFGRLFGGRDAASATHGLYLWGGVGRGKTFLVDIFYDSLDFPEKRRTHFHRFMREIHARLKQHAGERDPMAIIAKEWRRDMRVLVLDEFFVSDIGDAMLLARLLERLFACLLYTSRCV